MRIYVLSKGEADHLKQVYIQTFETGEKVTNISSSKILVIKPPSTISTLNKLGRKETVKRKSRSHIELEHDGVKITGGSLCYYKVIEELLNSVTGLEQIETYSEGSKIKYAAGRSEKYSFGCVRYYFSGVAN